MQSQQQAIQMIQQQLNQGMSPKQLIANALQQNPGLRNSQLGPILEEMQNKGSVEEMHQYADSIYPHIEKQFVGQQAAQPANPMQAMMNGGNPMQAMMNQFTGQMGNMGNMFGGFGRK